MVNKYTTLLFFSCTILLVPVIAQSPDVCSRGYAPAAVPLAPACHLAEDSLILAYEFEDSSNVGLDASPNQNDAVAVSVNLNSQDPPQGGSSVSMTNTNHIELPTLDLDLDTVSIAFWLKVDLASTTKTSWNHVFRWQNGLGQSISSGFFRDFRPGVLYFFLGDGSSPSTYSQVDPVSEHPGVGDDNQAEIELVDGVWYHIAWVIDSQTSQWTIHASGIGSFVFSGMLTHTRGDYATNTINSDAGKNFVGVVDNFRVYGKALTMPDVESVRTDGVVWQCPAEGAPAVAESAAAVTAAENLLVWYKFESNFLDSSPNAHHASNPGGGAVFSTEAHLGDFSLRQEGFTQAQQTHVRFPDTFDFYEAWNGQGVSISLWFKMPVSSETWANVLFQFSDKDSDTWPINRITLGQRGLDNGFWLGINDPLLGDDVRYKQQNVLDGFLDDAWHHLVLRIAANGVWSLYIDSTNTGEIFTHLIPDVRYTVNGIGGSLWGDSLGTTGNVDDFRIYQQVLTAEEIAAIYAGDTAAAQSSSTTPAVTAGENLLAWYKFDAVPADGATLTNYGAGGAEFDATIHMQAGGIDQVAGSVLNHAYFWPANSALGSWLQIDASMVTTLDQTGYTISFWMIDNDVTDRDATFLVGKNIDQSISDLSIQIAPPYFSNVYHNNQGTSYASLSTDSNVITDGELAFMTFVRENVGDSSMKLKIFKNSVLNVENTYTAVDFIHADSPESIVMLGFNLDETWSFRDKSLEDFRIYDRALTAAEVAAIYAGDLSCDSGWTKMSRKCVRFFEEYVDWPTAQGHCAGLGGSLAYARDQAGHDVLVDLWSQRSAASSTSYAWVGVSDTASEGSWTTIHGQAMPYSKWCPNQPDNGANEDCVHLRSGYGSSGGPCYNDNVCAGNTMMHYFCEVYPREPMAASTSPESTEPSAGDTAASATPGCVACTKGQYSHDGTECLPCPPGLFSVGVANAGCESCENGKHSFRGADSCFDLTAFLQDTGCDCPSAVDHFTAYANALGDFQKCQNMPYGPGLSDHESCAAFEGDFDLFLEDRSLDPSIPTSRAVDEYEHYCIDGRDSVNEHTAAYSAHCCLCGGGERDTRCRDKADWIDSEGYGCWMYQAVPHRCDSASTFSNGAMSASNACCVCGGGEADLADMAAQVQTCGVDPLFLTIGQTTTFGSNTYDTTTNPIIAWNLNGGPHGAGSITCDDSEPDDIEGGPHVFDIDGNGGLTIVTMFKATSAVNWARIVTFFSGTPENNLFRILRTGTASDIKLALISYDSATNSESEIAGLRFDGGGDSTAGAPQTAQNTFPLNKWITVVIHMDASTTRKTITLKTKTEDDTAFKSYTVTTEEEFDSREITKTALCSKDENGEDIEFAGFFAVDEFLPQTAVDAIIAGMEAGTPMRDVCNMAQLGAITGTVSAVTPGAPVVQEATVDGETVYTFLSDGTTAQTEYMLDITGAGKVDVLIVGGGGGGGSVHAGGGGGGGLIYLSGLSLHGLYTVNVGMGGAGGVGASPTSSPGVQGSSSSLQSSDLATNYQAIGGGGGGTGYPDPPKQPTVGGGSSGGLGGSDVSRDVVNSHTPGQGYSGGVSVTAASSQNWYDMGAGGGGGAGGVGGTAVGYQPGDGGSGKEVSISGTLTFYAGGGGGGSNQQNTSSGGSGGGGAGSKRYNGGSGIVNTGGGGGGGGGSWGDGGHGGSGIVIVRLRAGPAACINSVQNSISCSCSTAGSLTSATHTLSNGGDFFADRDQYDFNDVMPAELQGQSMYAFNVADRMQVTITINTLPTEVFVLYVNGNDNGVSTYFANQGFELVEPNPALLVNDSFDIKYYKKIITSQTEFVLEAVTANRYWGIVLKSCGVPELLYLHGKIDCDMASCPAGYTHVADEATCATAAASEIVTTNTAYMTGTWTDWGGYCFYSIEYDKIFYTTSSSGSCASSTEAILPICILDAE